MQIEDSNKLYYKNLKLEKSNFPLSKLLLMVKKKN